MRKSNSIVNHFKKNNDFSYLYNNNRWRNISKKFLTKNPLCVNCLKNGIIKSSEETDHILPHRGDKEKFWDQKNWQALCKVCHSKKTYSEVLQKNNTPNIYNVKNNNKIVLYNCPPNQYFLNYIFNKHKNSKIIYKKFENVNDTHLQKMEKHNNFINELNSINVYLKNFDEVVVVIFDNKSHLKKHYMSQFQKNFTVLIFESLEKDILTWNNKLQKLKEDIFVYI